jgi:hypothetical protein
MTKSWKLLVAAALVLLAGFFVMPTSKGEAKTQAELFDLAMIPTSTTGKKAINALLAAGEVERIGKGGQGHEYRYFLRELNRESVSFIG